MQGNNKGTALHGAARQGFTAIVEALIAADPSPDFIRIRASLGETALYWASSIGKTAIVEALVAADPSPDHIGIRRWDDGGTALSVALNDEIKCILNNPSMVGGEINFCQGPPTLLVRKTDGDVQWTLVFDDVDKFVGLSGYYVQFLSPAAGLAFITGVAGEYEVIQGGNGWSNRGGMTLWTSDSTVRKSNGASPFHPNENTWALLPMQQEAQCADQPWVVAPEMVNIHDTASVVPAVVSFNGVPFGWPGNNNKCDQFVAMGVDDGLVHGVSTSIQVGFSLPFFGTSGEEIEFRYWNAAENKIYYSEYRHTFVADEHLGSFRPGQEFVLDLQETPYKTCETKNDCRAYEFCGFDMRQDDQVCLAYAGLGESCGGYSDVETRCDPDLYLACDRSRNDPRIADASGECQPRGPKFYQDDLDTSDGVIEKRAFPGAPQAQQVDGTSGISDVAIMAIICVGVVVVAMVSAFLYKRANSGKKLTQQVDLSPNPVKTLDDVPTTTTTEEAPDTTSPPVYHDTGSEVDMSSVEVQA